MTQHVHVNEIKAWADGAKIEARRIGDKDWSEIDTPLWLYHKEYRVKPQPEYVPYSWEDRFELIGKGYVCEEEGFYSLVVSVGENNVNVYTFAEAFEKLTHTDGTPFGKLKA